MTGKTENFHLSVGCWMVAMCLLLKKGWLNLTKIWFYLMFFMSLVNLTSRLQIVNESDCIVAFSKHMCILQDRTSKMLFSTGEWKDGLYYYRGQQQILAHKVNRVGSIDLWHARLGHPSHKVIKWIPGVDTRKDSAVLNKLCDICHCAKHTRNSLPLSENSASNLFEMIHCDLQNYFFMWCELFSNNRGWFFSCNLGNLASC